MEVLVTLLICALGVAIYFSNKYKNEVANLKEKIHEQRSSPSRKIVSVAFEEGATQLYDYFIGDNDLKIGDRVQVPCHSKITGKNEVKIVTVKYVSALGEQSHFARSNVIRKVDSLPPFNKNFTNEKRFVKVIFEKDAEKSYDYLINDFDVKVGDFVVVRTGHINSGKAKLKSAQIIYISAPGETSSYAKTPIIKKAKKNKW